jgi:NTP pyrophosphatase (non-canonical NTP hydrolase)
MTKPYCIGSDDWNGLSKLIEECGEVMQVAGKIIGAEGAAQHWDGSNLRDRLEAELADLMAAIDYLRSANKLDGWKIDESRAKKFRKFCEWDDSTRARVLHSSTKEGT